MTLDSCFWKTLLRQINSSCLDLFLYTYFLEEGEGKHAHPEISTSAHRMKLKPGRELGFDERRKQMKPLFWSCNCCVIYRSKTILREIRVTIIWPRQLRRNSSSFLKGVLTLASTLRLNNLKTKTILNAKISVFVITELA